MNSKNYLILFLLSFSTLLQSQSLYLRFCGKNTIVTPKNDPNGNDQRYKGGIRLDFIRVGLNGQSRSNPFYRLGVNGTGLGFKNDVQVDGCNSNPNFTFCSGCTICKTIMDNSNNVVANPYGKMIDNVRIRTNNNDLYIESTGTQNVVCIETQAIDVKAHAGKRLELNFAYEGTVVENFTTVNINAEYRFTNGNWTSTLNQNSNFLRYIDTAIFVPVVVPAVENLDQIVQFKLSPVPATDVLYLEYQSQNTFDAEIEIIDESSRLVYSQHYLVLAGSGKTEVDVKDLSKGYYILQIIDKEGRLSFKKFIKQ